MKKILTATLFSIVILLFGTALAADFSLKSPHLTPGDKLGNDQIYNGFGCTGKNISPALQWDNVPEGTKSFAVTLFDPDAPTGSGWWHWVIFNIPADVTHLKENAGDIKVNLAPKESIQSTTDFGSPGFGGACPPPGDEPHHYQFSVYALDTYKLPLDKTATPAMVGFYIHQHKLAKATLTFYYSR